MAITVFISCVRTEFSSCRDHLARELIAVGLKPVYQTALPDATSRLLQHLCSLVRGSTYVVHLVGVGTGEKPEEFEVEDLLSTDDQLRRFLERHMEPAAIRRLTYTQWEAWLGLYYKGGCFVYKYNSPSVGFVHVNDAKNAGFQSNESEAKDQAAHFERLRTWGQYRRDFWDYWELSTRVLVSIYGSPESPMAPEPNAPARFVIGMVQASNVYVFRADLHWGIHWIRVVDKTEVRLGDRRRRNELISLAMQRAGDTIDQLPANSGLVVELVLPRAMILEPLETWSAIGLSTAPNVRREIHRHYPLRLRLAERLTGHPAAKVKQRVTWWAQHDRLSMRVMGEQDEAHPESAWAYIHENKPPRREWWERKPVVCVAFVRKPHLPWLRHAARVWGGVWRGGIAGAPERGVFQSAIDAGVPFIVWPDGEGVDRQVLAQHLQDCGFPAKLCQYFHELTPGSYCVLDESSGSPWPKEPPLGIEVSRLPEGQ
jgi:hypothetical protein